MLFRRIVFLSLLFTVVFLDVDKRDLFVIHAEKATSTIDIVLEEKINEILQNERLYGSITGISVRLADTGEEIYANQSDIRLHPASNMKVLTAIAALEILGSDYQFSTNVYIDGEMVGDGLQGNVYIKGQGDPTLQKEDLNFFAKALKEHGIKEIDGQVIGDDTWYDDIRLSQDLNWSDEPFHTGAQISALTLSPTEDYDAGTVLLEVFPSKVGEPAQIKVTPATDYVNIINKTTTLAEGQGENLSIDRDHGSNDIIVTGGIAVDQASKKSWAAVWDPTKYVLDVFRKSLEDHGIQLPKQKGRIGKVPEHATRIVKRDSMPLRDLLLPFMKLSNNGHAEVLVKEMGKVVYGEGSWDKGIEAMETILIELGAHPDAIQVRDGSGMSHKNFVTASELTKLLHIAQEREWYPTFFNALPIAGKPERLVGGTLRHRMKEEPLVGNVYAKTGSITGVQTLSGYITTKSGEKVIFSVLFNNYIDNSVTGLLDEIVRVIATHR